MSLPYSVDGHFTWREFSFQGSLFSIQLWPAFLSLHFYAVVFIFQPQAATDRLVGTLHVLLWTEGKGLDTLPRDGAG